MKLLIAAFMFSNSVPLQAQATERQLLAKESIRAARRATTYEAKELIYKQIDETTIQDDEDVREIFDELKNFPLDTTEKKQTKRRLRAAQKLADAIGKTQGAARHGIIRRLLEEEALDIPNNYMGPWDAKTELQQARAALRFGRYQALVEAAGAGKNAEALPVLRRLKKKGGEAGKSAEVAIGQIGHEEDLNNFINEIKRDPQSRVSIAAFGDKAIDRIMNEVESTSIPDAEKIRLMGAIPMHVTPEQAFKIRRLLKHPNLRVVAAAARVVGASASEDEGSVRQLLASPNRAVQDSGLNAIGRDWNPKYLPDVLKILKSDPEAFRRSLAANILGQHKVVEAAAALQESVAEDPDSNVRDSAAFALKRMGK